MLGTLDFLRGVGHKIRGTGINQSENGGERVCRSVMVQLPSSKPIDIEFNDITYTVSVKKEKKKVLKGLNGKFKSGELTAIMGPSGAGKSSLLNILTGFQTTGVSGSISNQECGKNMSSDYKKESCYILQDDHLYPNFTVEEVMKMATDLKLGQNLSPRAKSFVIDNVLETLGLTQTKPTRCGQLSGGQKKRLSIALELIDNPPVMFLDEPTTGLDSSSSLQCISMLKELAHGGRTIICTIHQPPATAYEMFDHVYIMAEGMCIYQGASKNTVEYLKTFGLECPKYHNPADYILEIANCEYGNFNKQLADAAPVKCWREQKKISEEESPVVHTEDGKKNKPSQLIDTRKATILIHPPSESSKFWILTRRSLTLLYRDWTVTHLKLVLHIIVGIILGSVFANCGSDGARTISNVGFLLIGIVYLSFTSMMPAVLRFPHELLILKKESFNNWYKLRTYYAAFVLCNTPLQVFYSILYCSPAYFLSSQPSDSKRFLMFVLALCLIALISESVGHIIGTLTDPVNGTFWGSVLFAIMMLYAGFLVLFNHMTSLMYAVSYVSMFRYCLEALILAIYGYNRPALDCPEDQVYCHLRNPSKLLEELSMTEGDYWKDIGALVIGLVGLKTIAFFTLRRNLRKS